MIKSITPHTFAENGVHTFLLSHTPVTLECQSQDTGITMLKAMVSIISSVKEICLQISKPKQTFKVGYPPTLKSRHSYHNIKGSGVYHHIKFERNL